MEKQPRFDLKEAVCQWRNALAQSGSLSQEQLDELEHHLVDSMADLRSRQLTEEESFLIARRRIGNEDVLARECAKVKPGRIWEIRLGWIFLIFLAYPVVGVPQFLAIAFTRKASFYGINGHLVGLLALAIEASILVAAVGLVRWIDRTNPRMVRRFINGALNRPILSAVCLIVLSVIIAATRDMPSVLLNRMSMLMAPEVQARFFTAWTWQAYGHMLAQFIVIPIALIYIVKRSQKLHSAS